MVTRILLLFSTLLAVVATVSNAFTVHDDAARFQEIVEATVAAEPMPMRPVVEVTRVVYATATPEVALEEAALRVAKESGAKEGGATQNNAQHNEVVTPNRNGLQPIQSRSSSENSAALLSTEREVIDLINAARQTNGQKLLQLSPELVEAARRHSRDMATRNLTWHTGSDNSTYQQRIAEAGYTGAAVNEAIFYGSSLPADSVNWWLGDEHHRPILFSTEYTQIGISLVSEPTSAQRHYWTLTFGDSSGSQQIAQDSQARRGGVGGPITENAPIPNLGSAPQLTVNEEVVNVRQGPSVEYAAVGVAEAGQRYSIVGKNQDSSWWQVCCFQGLTVWIIDLFVATSGDPSQTPLIEVGPPTALSPESIISPALVEPAPSNDSGQNQFVGGSLPFELLFTARHLETNIVTIYSYVQENNNALDGYFLRITKDGQVMTNRARSSAIPLGTTKPGTPSSAENKVYNLKVDFNSMSHPDFDPTGSWTAQLVNGNQEAVSPPTSFTIRPNDDQKEIYLRYQKR